MWAYLDSMLFMIKYRVREFWVSEEGDVNVVSIVILIGIAVLLAALFKGQIMNLLNALFETINNNAKNVVVQ